MTDATEAYEIVADFLKRFYYDEPSNDVATSLALRAQSQNYRDRWRYACAFDALNAHAWPLGALTELVRTAGRRLVVDDDDATRFLSQVYENNDFDLALDPDESYE